MVTYATAMSVEASVKYNHIHAEAAQAITTAQIYLQAAEMQPDPQPPAPVTQTQNTNPDNLMDVGEQTPAETATEHLQGRETGDEQVLKFESPAGQHGPAIRGHQGTSTRTIHNGRPQG